MTAEPVIDRERLTLISRGRSELAREFVAVFVSETAGVLERLAALSAAADAPAVRDAAHTVKGMAAEIGAPRLRALAAAFEAEVDPAEWPRHAQRLRAALNELEAEARTL